jgi:AcrR family transcriptional regulator
MPDSVAKTTARAGGTRELILIAAERLFAEQGVVAVSNRQISEAAGQGNNAAVGYHFGSKADLVRAIVRKHTRVVEQKRLRMLADIGDSAELRDWVACWVRPFTQHLDELGSPTWYARFAAQAMVDPAFREIMFDEAFGAQALELILDGLNRHLPTLPLAVAMERREMERHLLLQICAERERALALGISTPRLSWDDTATGLIDAIVGVWLAPVTGSS